MIHEAREAAEGHNSSNQACETKTRFRSAFLISAFWSILINNSALWMPSPSASVWVHEVALMYESTSSWWLATQPRRFFFYLTSLAASYGFTWADEKVLPAPIFNSVVCHLLYRGAFCVRSLEPCSIHLTSIHLLLCCFLLPQATTFILVMPCCLSS